MAASSARLTLHWLDKSRAQRILFLLEELKLQYRLVTYKRLSDNQAPASLRAVHPLGKSPVLEIHRDHWAKPLILAESATIIEYVAEHFGRNLVPEKWKQGTKVTESEADLGEETDEWMKYKFYMNYSEGSLMNLIGTGAIKNAIKDAPLPFFLKPLTRRIAGEMETSYLNHNYEAHLSFLESELSNYNAQVSGSEPKTPFICGPKLTAADFMMVFPLEAAQSIAGLTEAKYPLLMDYVKRMQEREGYKKAAERIIQETGSYEPGI